MKSSKKIVIIILIVLIIISVLIGGTVGAIILIDKALTKGTNEINDLASEQSESSTSDSLIEEIPTIDEIAE